jgi:hypothetical protein
MRRERFGALSLFRWLAAIRREMEMERKIEMAWEMEMER